MASSGDGDGKFGFEDIFDAFFTARKLRSVRSKVSFSYDGRRYEPGFYWHPDCVPPGMTVASDPGKADFVEAAAPSGSRCPRCGEAIG